MKILERKELSVVGICPHCGSKLELEKGDIWWHKDIDGGKDPCVTCAACGKGFSVEGLKNISKLYISQELAESEDARMKESIIATIHLYYGEPLEDEAKKMIAWLEKQGKKDEEILILEDNIESLHAAIKALKEVHKIELEKQGEHKIQLGKKYKCIALSEEDEKVTKWVIDYIGNCPNESFDFYGGVGKEAVLSWLNKLKNILQLQPKQEWSEEDENHVKSILSTIECCKAQLPNAQAVVEAYNADIEWLKSLRPQSQWKPSDMELEVLRLAAEKDGTCLMGLYEQLKKLREE